MNDSALLFILVSFVLSYMLLMIWIYFIVLFNA